MRADPGLAAWPATLGREPAVGTALAGAAGDTDPCVGGGELPATPRVEQRAAVCPNRLGCDYSLKLGGSV